MTTLTPETLELESSYTSELAELTKEVAELTKMVKQMYQLLAGSKKPAAPVEKHNKKQPKKEKHNKKQPCIYWGKGNCRFGDTCNFAHP